VAAVLFDTTEAAGHIFSQMKSTKLSEEMEP
jgi:hypothetical protein